MGLSKHYDAILSGNFKLKVSMIRRTDRPTNGPFDM